MKDNWISILQKQNYVLIKRDSPLCSLSEIKQALCIDKVKAARLLANDNDDSRPNTLSSRYGLNVFPPHTDGAIESLPPHYIMLVSPNARTTQTYLYRFSDIEMALGKEVFNTALFEVCGGKTRFYSGIVTSGEPILCRYNPAIMHPINHAAETVSNYINQRLEPHTIIDWKDNKAAIINNRKILHSRGEILDKTKINYLRRLSLWSLI